MAHSLGRKFVDASVPTFVCIGQFKRCLSLQNGLNRVDGSRPVLIMPAKPLLSLHFLGHWYFAGGGEVMWSSLVHGLSFGSRDEKGQHLACRLTIHTAEKRVE